MPQLGPDYDLATRLKRVEDWIARQGQNPIGQAFSATQSDGSVGFSLGQSSGGSGAMAMQFMQGPTTPRDPSTNQHPLLAYFGELFSGGVSVDSGVLWYRPDGSESMVIGNRGVQILDPKGNQVLATDEYGTGPANEGLINPRIPLPMPLATGIDAWPKTTATTMSTVAWSQFDAQHEQVWWVAQFTADTGTNGSVQLNLSGPGGASVTGPTYAVTGGVFGFTNDVLTLPSGFWHQAWTANVQAEVTSGTGNVYCQTVNLYGLSTN